MKDPPPTTAPERLSLGDTLAFGWRVFLPTFAKGLMIRRPRVVSYVARHDLDGRAVREMARLAAAYGGRPVRLAIPFRTQVLVLSADDVARVLADAPDPFSPATREKAAALGHFEPAASLISTGEARTVRRRFSDDVLESDRTRHSMAEPFLRVVREEAAALAAPDGFGWHAYREAWARAVRRIVLGDGARHDERLTEDLDSLRRAGNWLYLHPPRRRLLRRMLERLEAHLARAEPGSLAARVAARKPVPGEATAQQVTHWLFAFDAAAIAGIRALALLATHPAALASARAEAAPSGPGPFLRGAILEALRLYPTTPLILRETTREATLSGATLPARAGVIIYAPFVHRDDALPEAHVFAPQIWLPGGVARVRPFVPFGGGPALCPARHLVPMLAADMVREVIASRVELVAGDVPGPGRPLPATLDHGALRFRLSPRPPAAAVRQALLPQAGS